MLLAAPYLRRHKSFTTMAFISERYGSRTLRFISVIIMLIVSVLYLGGNLKGIGIVFITFWACLKLSVLSSAAWLLLYTLPSVECMGLPTIKPFRPSF
jgi:Na+(H+)/acetate symporter ActP